MKDHYLNIVSSVERLHRLFLDVVRVELDLLRVYDINNVQALVLYHLGKAHLTVSELTNRGYYLGSNVSYNLKKMIERGYIEQTVSAHDRRVNVVKLTAKGLEFTKKFDAALNRQVALLTGQDVAFAEVEQSTDLLRRVETFWSSLLIRR
ncbi:MAG: MarR family winged helix-turn-helix transcriptional regulator [Holosporales bacterium]|jgi:DNA-binding MarR family transcriptional regulator|nr:MarR family winged helix-turn-helix transcriptional regulator [Holosporales bacterium]